MARSTNLKDRLIEGAISILNVKGYGALSMAEVARELGVSKQSAYYHYPGSEELVLLVARRWSESGQRHAVHAIAMSTETGHLKVLAIADGLFNWIEADPELARLALTLYPLGKQLKALGKFMDQARDAGRDRIATYLESDPLFKTKKPKRLNEMITALHSYMYGSFFYLFAIEDIESLAQARRTCLNGLSALLNAFAKEK